MVLALSLWSLSTVILSASYSGNLNAYLVAVDYARPIDTAADVLKSGKTLYLPVRYYKPLYKQSDHVTGIDIIIQFAQFDGHVAETSSSENCGPGR